MNKLTTPDSQTTNLNSKQIEEIRAYLSQAFGNYCGANSDDNKGCGKTVTDLEYEWKAEQKRKNRKICECGWSPFGTQKPRKNCPNCKGIFRIAPFLLINEKYGRGPHRFINEKIQQFGNTCYYCYSCNNILDRREGDTTNDSSTDQFRKSHTVRPKFKNEILNHLAKHVEICYMGCSYGWSDRPDYNCSESLIKNCISQLLASRRIELFKAIEFGIECSQPMCNGEHIALTDKLPTTKESDYQAFLDEQED